MNDEKIIRDLYGEKMWKECKKLFPTILLKEGALSKILQDHFNPSRFLYEDIIKNNAIYEFQKYIYSLSNIDINKVTTLKTVRELLNEKGYDLYECHTEEDIQRFKKYYAPHETICTITNGNRLERNYVFFAVKKNVDSIQRSESPRRDDDYGTSVISIQFTKGDLNILMITNRYNHRVPNSDATFDNNLENINIGLTDAFEREYHLKTHSDEKQEFIMPNYIKANDGKYYKYNQKMGNIYFCTNNIIIDNGKVITDYQDKEKYLIIDCYILDLQNHKIKCYNKIGSYDFLRLNDAECSNIDDDNYGISRMSAINSGEGKIINIKLKNGCESIIHINKYNQIVYIENNNQIREVSDLLDYSESIETLKLRNVKTIGERFGQTNQSLKYVSFDNTKTIENEVLSENIELKALIAPSVTSIGEGCLRDNQALKYIDISSVEKIEIAFLFNNNTLKNIELPNLKETFASVLYKNQYIDIFDYTNEENVNSHWSYLD